MLRQSAQGLALLAVMTASTVARADEKPTTPVDPNAPAASEAKPEEPAKPEADKPAPPSRKPKDESAADEVGRVYPLENPEWIKDPFLILDMEMEAVVEDFNVGKSKAPALVTQPRIVSRFDAVIELMEKKMGGAGPGGAKGPPAEQSTLAKGPGGSGELRTPKKTGKGYDDLTPREREKILQSKTEGFPPGFEDVLADYYRRLAKADAAPAESADAAKPAVKPDKK